MRRPPGWLVDALHAEAERHDPDSARIRARMEDAIGPLDGPRRGGRWRVAAVAAVAAAVLVAVPLAVTHVGQGPRARGGPAGSQAPAGRMTSPAPPPRTITVAGSTAPGSGPYWGEERVELTVVRPVTALDVTLTVRRAAGPVGAWQSVGDMTAGRHVSGPRVRYAFRLGHGRTVTPGTYRFAVQFGRSRAARTVSYEVSASGGERRSSVRGVVRP